jgi:hypothetical protein
MASITPSIAIAEAKGAVGNLVYSRNFYGSYVKARVTPTNPNSTRQQDWRARLAAAVAAWQASTLAEKLPYQAQADARNVHSRIGKWQKITAYNLFIRQQLLASKAGTEGTPTNPVPLMNEKYEVVSFSFSESAMTVTVSGPVNASNTFFSLKAGAPRGSGRLSFNPSQIILLADGTVLASDPEVLDFTSAYVTAFGSLAGQAGKLVTIGLQSFNDLSGERSANFFYTGEIQP